MSENSGKIIKAKILPECFVSVVVPARNEAENLTETLNSLTAQKDIARENFEVILLINNCSDNSFEIAQTFQQKNKNLNLHVAELNTSKKNANGGFVRRLLMEEAYLRLIGNDKRGGIILTTDGDTIVAEDWIAANIREIENGADAVGGRILFTENELLKMNPFARKFHLIDEKYRLLSAELESNLDPVSHDLFPRHHQHFNGSFAVKTEIYKKAGGVPDVRCMEDVAFYQSLMRIDAKFRHSLKVKVYTSARETGRTEAGLSTQINDWINLSKSGENFLVESAETLQKRFTAHAKLRIVWQNRQNGFEPQYIELEELADLFCVPFEFLQNEIFKPQTFGLLLENVYKMQNEIKDWSWQNPLVPIEKAVDDLEAKLKKPKRKKAISIVVN